MFCKPVKKRRLIFMKNFLIYILLIFFFCSYSYSQSDFATSVENDSVNSLEESSQEPALQTGDSQSFVWLINNSSYAGTAFPIGPNLFVTNFHVLASISDKILASISDNTSISDNKSLVKNIALQKKEDSYSLTIKKVVAVSALYDLVLFETEESVTNYLNISDSPIQPNEELLIPGYPRWDFKEIKKTGKADDGGYDGGYHYTFPVNRSSLFGFSGSPVLNAKRQVVGVATLGSNNILSAVKSKYLKRLISEDMGLNCSNLSLVICIEEEIKNLKKLAEQGDALAQYKLAFLYYDGSGIEKNLELAFVWMQKSAEQGNALFQYDLAMMYYKGEGIEKNLELAFYWYRESAKQGYAPAQHNLSLMYSKGEGVERNLELAFVWMQKSAEQGNAPAQYNLSLMYFNGEGVEKNLELAFHWMQESAKQNFFLAQQFLEEFYKKLPQN